MLDPTSRNVEQEHKTNTDKPEDECKAFTKYNLSDMGRVTYFDAETRVLTEERNNRGQGKQTA